MDILPPKTCNLNCIYCELGPTEVYLNTPCEPVSPGRIEEAFRNFLSTPHPPFDCLTITASGEPTLHRAIGEITERLKRISPVPLALLTNSTMLYKDHVRAALKNVDVLLPSLDAGCEETFKKINRPGGGVKFNNIIQGFETLKMDYRGRILLEILFVAGVNDSPGEIERLKQYVEKIAPDEVQVSTISRPPADPRAMPVTHHKLMAICRQFGQKARIITSFTGDKKQVDFIPSHEELVELIKRRPLNEQDIKALFSPYHEQVMERLNELLRQGFLRKDQVRNSNFYVVRDK